MEPAEQTNASASRFLFLLYIYPPYFGTAPVRNYNISKYLLQKSDRSFIYTTTNRPVSREAAESLGASVSFEQLPTLDYRTRIFRKKKHDHFKEIYKTNFLSQFIIKLFNSFPFQLIFSEGGLVYIFSGIYKGIKLVKKEKITHVYSSYRPLADHYIAFALKIVFPGLIWVADFRDLIIEPFYKQLFFPKLHQRLYRRIFRKANVLITISDGLAKHLHYYNPRVIVVKNGIDARPEKTATLTEKFTISYTGSMFLNKRNPEPLLKVISNLLQKGVIQREKIKICYAGKDGSYWQKLCKKYNLSDLLEDKGLVSQGDAKELQKVSNLNLLLSIASDEFEGILTGKLVEYLEAGSPVLGINVGRTDPEVIRILHVVNAGECFSDAEADLAGIEAFVVREYDHWLKTGYINKPVDTEALMSNFSTGNTMKELTNSIF